MVVLSIVRQAYYVSESFLSAIQALFSKENKTHQILSYFKKHDSFISFLNEYPQLLKTVIPSLNDDDASAFRQKYKDTESFHLGNIKDKEIYPCLMIEYFYLNGISLFFIITLYLTFQLKKKILTSSISY